MEDGWRKGGRVERERLAKVCMSAGGICAALGRRSQGWEGEVLLWVKG